MKLITMIYILNSTLLILHEIESAYEKEWEILKLPGKITGFMLLHIPIVLLIFYGLIEIEKISAIISFIHALLITVGGIDGIINKKQFALIIFLLSRMNPGFLCS